MTTVNSSSDTTLQQAGPAPVIHAQSQDRHSKGPRTSLIYGSFWIDKTEFALPVKAIREVVSEPEVVSSVPLAPPYLKGLFNLRGMIVPVIDLRILLELPQKNDTDLSLDGRKVAIIENGDKCVGILFDRPGEVLDEPGSARVDFHSSLGDSKNALIEGVLKLENGNRMVLILEPHAICQTECIPRGEADALRTSQRSDLGKRLSCISFQLGQITCAFDLRHVHEVRDMPPVDNSLFNNGYVIGTVSLRGNVVPVVDFRSFLGNEAAYKLSEEELNTRKLLVMRAQGGLIGLMVFSIDNIIPFFETAVMPFAKLALPRSDMIKGCLTSDDNQLVVLLDHERLLSDPGLAETARTCHQMHNNRDADSDISDRNKTFDRRTFILCSIANCFAMDTRAVCEVIEKPPKMLHPPSVYDFVEGIFDLRGELITLINLRLLFGIAPCKDAEQKVLIFKQGSEKYAILVDSVDEMVMTSADMITNDKNNPVSGSFQEVSSLLHVARPGQKTKLVMIMDTDALVAKCQKAMNAGLTTDQDPEPSLEATT